VPLSLDTRFKILFNAPSIFGFASAKNAFAQLVWKSAREVDSDSLRSIARIRFAQFIASRSNRPPPNPAPSSLRSQKKTTRQKRGCFSSVSPLRVFSFASSGFWLRVRLWAVRPFRVGFVCVAALSGFLWRSFLLAVFMSALVGFCGSRSLPSAFSPLVSSCVSAVVAAGRGVAVGCASGADRFALTAARSLGASVSLFLVSSFGSGRGSFARRSAALVSAVSVSGSGCGLVAFVSSSCPPALAPSSVASRCFAGFGSGSWASVAFAVGRGVLVVVFPCVPAGVSPLSVLPAWSGYWVVAGSGVWSSGFRFVPSSSASLPF